jgi:hypothetical protein
LFGTFPTTFVPGRTSQSSDICEFISFYRVTWFTLLRAAPDM